MSTSSAPTSRSRPQELRVLMRSRADSDFATPLRRATATVALEIDGRAVAVPAGTSVIRAAAEAGIHVPRLCATDSLEPFGSCRLCLVEIDSQRLETRRVGDKG